MDLDEFIKQLEEYWSDFNCGDCNAFNESCNTNYSCNTQCLKQFMEENNLIIVKLEDLRQ